MTALHIKRSGAVLAKDVLAHLLNFPCPHCPYVRHVSVESKRVTVVLPRVCPTRQTYEDEVLRAYYVEQK